MEGGVAFFIISSYSESNDSLIVLLISNTASPNDSRVGLGVSCGTSVIGSPEPTVTKRDL